MANSPVTLHRTFERDPSQPARENGMSLSLALALQDEALGTTPLSHQQTAISLLKADIPYITAAIPRILSALIISIINRGRKTSWADLREAILYSLLSLLQLQFLLSICLLWPVVPGIILLPWLSLQAVSIWILLHVANNQPISFKYTANQLGDDALIDEECHLDWFVIGGLMDNERMRRELPPKLARIFGHDMHIFLPRRLGFIFDIVLTLFQRNVYIPTGTSVALYQAIRTSLLKPETSGVRILAHHTGTLDVSWLLARLCSDFPSGAQLSKLQVFTFGAASIEMTLPLGRAYQKSEDNTSPSSPSITHFAFTDDPFAQFGVLLGIRQRLEGRFVGSLYTIRGTIQVPTRSCLLPRDCHYTFDDYLDALVPSGDPHAGVLGQICKVDRELSEMRELAALAQSVANERLRTRRTRLSWTALGAIANNTSSGHKGHDDMAGPYSLEEVRKKVKSLEGLKGYEDNPFADAVIHRYRPRPKNHTPTQEAIKGPRGRRTGINKCDNRRRGS
ncbi:uncharacterized protein GGS22DRAFT_98041 [Annulohypoxylon maeteangense]|uniref:uncharacterized protein n=1 Tax=Annulohypoxylon maeteangense TaxID=1927788 RepID=UPI002007C23F|nr:uncharacterized protein GGS22DRAFT_98041 [Annulohypoxylon maeteangense]KAI0888501.1 hypothetical protein GGS22DRAFT_98041 [Annulohypoxylon maeteangense]